MDSFSDSAMKKDYFFSNRDLAKLFIPLIIEQGLEFWSGNCFHHGFKGG